MFTSIPHMVLVIVLFGTLMSSMTGETMLTMYIVLGLLYAGIHLEN
jgi:hypothetical protein